MRSDMALYRRMPGIFWVIIVGFGMLLVPLVMLAVTVPARLGWYPDSFVRDLGSTMDVVGIGYVTMSMLSLLVVLLLSTTAGSVDWQRGVLRDLALTGRPIPVTLLRRVTAAAIWCVLAIAVALSATLLIAIFISPTSGSIDWSGLRTELIGLVLSLLVALLFGAGIAMLTGSRGPAIAVYFILSLVVDIALVAIPRVGDYWEHVSYSIAETQVLMKLGADTLGGAPTDANNIVVASIVFAAWGIVPLTAGIIRMSTRDL